ncbi:hypothetical protein Vretimale_19293, partial [Volvox reticuliferus]
SAVVWSKAASLTRIATASTFPPPVPALCHTAVPTSPNPFATCDEGAKRGEGERVEWWGGRSGTGSLTDSADSCTTTAAVARARGVAFDLRRRRTARREGG